MKTRIDVLRENLQKELDEVTAIRDRASDNGNLQEDDQPKYDEALTRAENWKAEIAKEEKANAFLSTPAPVEVPQVVNRAESKELDLRTAADIALAGFAAALPDVRASGAMARFRALTVTTSSSSAGSLREYVVGEIIRFVDAHRRTIDSFGVTTLPPGADFKVVVETTSANNVGIQNNEGDAITSTAMSTLSLVTVGHDTYAGGAALTLQSLYFPTPNTGEVWARVSAENYAQKSNAVVAAAFRAAVTQGIGYAATTGENVVKALDSAAGAVYSNSKSEADTIWMSPSVARFFRGIHLSSGEPYFPMLNPMNRHGASTGLGAFDGVQIGGLDVVIEPQFAVDTLIVGAKKYGYVFESMYPELQAWDIEHLTKEVAIAGELGTYFRPEGFIRLIDTDASATPNTV